MNLRSRIISVATTKPPAIAPGLKLYDSQPETNDSKRTALYQLFESQLIFLNKIASQFNETTPNNYVKEDVEDFIRDKWSISLLEGKHDALLEASDDDKQAAIYNFIKLRAIDFYRWANSGLRAPQEGKAVVVPSQSEFHFDQLNQNRNESTLEFSQEIWQAMLVYEPQNVKDQWIAIEAAIHEYQPKSTAALARDMELPVSTVKTQITAMRAQVQNFKTRYLNGEVSTEEADIIRLHQPVKDRMSEKKAA
ncbi:MAG: hypothetical protein HOA17_08555 [Candidatus Melainabacteria bacterium]|nr:hypothetical protein [Candidatus Melainabacteria bacterium]